MTFVSRWSTVRWINVRGVGAVVLYLMPLRALIPVSCAANHRFFSCIRDSFSFSGPLREAVFDQLFGYTLGAVLNYSAVIVRMGPNSKLVEEGNHFLRSANCRGGVVWCFIPIGKQQIGSCSAGFRSYFRLPKALVGSIPFTSDGLVCGLKARGLSVESLSADDGCPSGQVERPRELKIVSEVVHDASGLPTGRMLIFERTRMLGLPDQTVNRLRDSQEKLRVLSAREAEILDLVYSGLTNKAIGIQSKISEKTVEKHRSNIMHKLGIRNSSQLIRCVSEARLATELEVGER